MPPLAPLDVNLSHKAPPAATKPLPPLEAEEEASIKATVAALRRAEELQAAAQVAPLVPVIAGGPISCSRELGEGGFGRVWLGQQILDPALGSFRCRQVAVKIQRMGEIGSVSDNENDGFMTVEDVEREVIAHRQLFCDSANARCPQLLELFGHAIEVERAILVFELFDGIELQDHVTTEPNGFEMGFLREEEARGYAQQILSAISYAHSRGVAHLDIKPSNVLVNASTGHVKLIDWGSSSTFQADKWVQDFGGTQNYMSPERHLDEDSKGFHGPSADVYSVGCVIFFMLRGYPPYDWEYSLHPPYDNRKLLQRARANDPWGGPLGGACDDESEPEEEEQPRPPISPAAIALVDMATRFNPAERPAAASLMAQVWVSSNEKEQGSAADVDALTKLLEGELTC